MLDFDERDLFAFAERAGFGEVHLDLEARVAPLDSQPWDSFFRAAPNPLAPTLEEAVLQALTPEAAERFVGHLSPLVVEGQGVRRTASAYLWAIKR